MIVFFLQFIAHKYLIDLVMGILLHVIFNISNNCLKIKLMLIIRIQLPLICGSIFFVPLKILHTLVNRQTDFCKCVFTAYNIKHIF